MFHLSASSSESDTNVLKIVFADAHALIPSVGTMLHRSYIRKCALPCSHACIATESAFVYALSCQQ